MSIMHGHTPMPCVSGTTAFKSTFKPSCFDDQFASNSPSTILSNLE